MHKDSHTKPLHDATAQMAVNAQMQRHKWLSLQDATALLADEAVTHRPQTTTIATDAKPTKHTQTLTLRKARGIVRFWEVYAERGVVVQSLRLDGKKFAT